MSELFANTAALAAILGALTGAFGAIITATITAASSNRREQRGRLFAEKKLTYVEYLNEIRHLEQLAIHGTVPEEDRLKGDQRAISQLEIIASKKIRSLHAEVVGAVQSLVDARRDLIARLTEEEAAASEVIPVKDANFTVTHKRYSAIMSRMEAAMRRDLGGS